MVNIVGGSRIEDSSADFRVSRFRRFFFYFPSVKIRKDAFRMWNYTWLRCRFRRGYEFLFYISEKGKWLIEDEFLRVILLVTYVYIYYGNSMQGKVQHVDRVDCFEIDFFSFLLSFPSFWSKKFKSLDFFDFLFPFPPLPGGKIIQEEQTRALIYLQIEQDRGVSKRAGSEKHLNPSVKIIKPIRMDQLESKASIEPIKVGRQ